MAEVPSLPVSASLRWPIDRSNHTFIPAMKLRMLLKSDGIGELSCPEIQACPAAQQICKAPSTCSCLSKPLHDRC